MIEWATEKGMAQGIAQGMTQGIANGERKKALEITRNMLAMGIEISVIAKAIGLSEAEVESLKNE